MTTEATQANVRLTDGLGHLPKPSYGVARRDGEANDYGPWFSARQMFDYALQERAAERERWTADVCNALAMLRSGDATLAARMLGEFVGD